MAKQNCCRLYMRMRISRHIFFETKGFPAQTLLIFEPKNVTYASRQKSWQTRQTINFHVEMFFSLFIPMFAFRITRTRAFLLSCKQEWCVSLSPAILSFIAVKCIIWSTINKQKDGKVVLRFCMVHLTIYLPKRNVNKYGGANWVS